MKKTLRKIPVEALIDELRARRAANARGAGYNDVETGELIAAIRDGQRVIYGTDDRQGLFELDPQQHQALFDSADGVAALVFASKITDNGDGTSTIAGQQFATQYGLCPSERFSSQPCCAFCSGFLVAPDLIATAGHCIEPSRFPLPDFRFVFGYRMENATTARTVIANNEIYQGLEIVAWRLTSAGPDWGLVRLNRAVTNHRVLPIRKTGAVDASQRLYVIGHPCGLPAKHAGGASVTRDEAAEAFFVANLDTYGGNSGSPVFASDTNRVEGILVRGETDFEHTPAGCQISLVCPTSGCRGEDVTRSTQFSSLVP